MAPADIPARRKISEFAQGGAKDIKGLNNSVINNYLPQTERTAESAAARAAKNSDSRVGGEGDTLHLSPEARLLAVARSTAMQADDVRQERVDILKAQVEDGTYKIDSQKIATKLLQDEAVLFRQS